MVLSSKFWSVFLSQGHGSRFSASINVIFILFILFTSAVFSVITKLLVRAATVICRSGVVANAVDAPCNAL